MSHRKLGEILIDLGYLTEDQLWDVLEQQKNSPGELMGQIAVRLGLLSMHQVQTALEEQFGTTAKHIESAVQNHDFIIAGVWKEGWPTQDGHFLLQFSQGDRFVVVRSFVENGERFFENLDDGGHVTDTPHSNLAISKPPNI